MKEDLVELLEKHRPDVDDLFALGVEILGLAKMNTVGEAAFDKEIAGAVEFLKGIEAKPEPRIIEVEGSNVIDITELLEARK